LKQAEKEAERKARVEAQQKLQQTTAGMSAVKIDEESLDPNQYIEIRKKAIASLQESGVNTYPYKFHVSIGVQEFIERYNQLAVGEQLRDIKVSVAGRMHNIRTAGKKLRFYDLHSEGVKVQIHANAA
jgi:lysyl-tRNA synthetase class 2